MEFLFYLVQVNLYLILFYAFYRLVLFGETFHNLNRVYLVVSALLAFGIPLWYSEYIQSWFITKEINEVFYTIYDPSMILVRPTKNINFTWADILQYLYFMGISIGGIRLIITLSQLILVLKNKDFEKFTAFSFFGYSFVDETLKKRDTILAHEHVHMQQLHSADVMIFEIIAILNWFNPVVYLYKKDIKHIHEFIADEIAAKNETSKVDYAMLLFTQEFGLQPHQLTNRFFTHSTLKRRIQMLSKPRSNKIMLLKYGLSVPLFILMLVVSSATIVTNNVLEIVEGKLSSLGSGSVGFADESGPMAVNAIGAQEGVYIHGTITNEEGKPLPKATIQARDMLVVTGADGKYAINAQMGDTLRFYALNYKVVYVIVTDKSEINVSLKKLPVLSLAVESDKTVDVFTSTNQEVFTSVDESPSFPGGVKAIFAFIAQNLKYPISAQEANVSGKVFVKFIVRKDGSVSDIKVLQGIGFGCDEETVRVIAQMPKWNPGKQNGKPVNVYFTMPVNFVIEENAKQTPAKELANIRTQPSNIKLQGMNDPLVILDGREVKLAALNDISPKEIDKIDVLKSETATKPYGSKGINGVLLISTKAAPIELKLQKSKD